MGQFLGCYNEHSSLVKKFRNLSTGYISPQFHLVFDDLLETVIHTKYEESVFNAIGNELFELNRYWYAKDKHDENGKPI